MLPHQHGSEASDQHFTLFRSVPNLVSGSISSFDYGNESKIQRQRNRNGKNVEKKQHGKNIVSGSGTGARHVDVSNFGEDAYNIGNCEHILCHKAASGRPSYWQCRRCKNETRIIIKDTKQKQESLPRCRMYF